MWCPTDLQIRVTARQRLEAQQEENRAVQREFATLDQQDQSNNVYKLMGPVLVKQERDEAKRTVDGRLEYIDKEIKRVETTMVELQNKTDNVRAQLAALQQKVQMGQ